ncbi:MULTISPECIES: hypothetical protein [Xanthomonas]|uniref:hypothetical protein n=1 Tax=Xanthomonas TaxID=338 RepID=UPI001ADBF0F8|nr:hypothetical protein [Xanthomonas phaseoli]MBO9766471.1 hypothetical protein [Xanthomonas phaseoli pv. dieffenbachiae]MBO9776184.1 hypothetical protein [Xanthomonas phaseoli pv. dieffenbachiae]MBO9778217.1 hypothetical protein [Xanthomonas phaseoli pv. dieffenbachiae]MBO9795394.1 hypothetical protein [Xanthomonas phaseoli pv. dieffenbachiae]MBO9801411.1 hypothetical protein [Xanthomonas phaseoli pv. dieffenbachiae]
MTMHPHDRLAALEWALARAREAGKADELVRLTHVQALQELRDEAQREARGG